MTILIAVHCVQLHADVVDAVATQSETIENKVIQKVATAYRMGDRIAVWKAMAATMSKLDREDVPLLDDALAGQKLPNASAIFAEIRLTPGTWQTSLPRASRREVQLVLEHVDKTIDGVVASREHQLVLMDDRAPMSAFEDFERLVWESHVFRNQLENAAALAMAAGTFKKKYEQALASASNFEPTDYQEVMKNMYDFRVELHERDLELKIERLDYSRGVLADVDPKAGAADATVAAKARLWAAYSLQKDGQVVLEALREIEKGGALKFATQLNSPQARGKIRKQIRTGRELAGDMLVRSEHLFDGLHWWFRGRYGRGTHNGGLLKPPQAAVDQRAQMALMVPKSPPIPTDPIGFVHATDANKRLKSAGEQDDALLGNEGYVRTPDYDRRHHYIWSQEPPLFATQNVGLYFH